MAKERSYKIKLLKLWEILCRDSDEDHPLTTKQIMDRLQAEGIACDRRTLYSDMEELTRNGFEVMCRRSRNNRYYVVDRKFQLPEIKILIDAVQAAGFITPGKTEELVDKLAALAGSHRARLLKHNIVQFDTVKHLNESIYYSVSDICDAIVAGRQISFRYFDYGAEGECVYRKNGARYLVNPVTTVFAKDNYYLIAYDPKYEGSAVYRVDRMDRVAIEPSERMVPEAILHTAADHKVRMFSMYGGKTADVTFEAEVGVIDVLVDQFGKALRLSDAGGGKVTFTATVGISPTFFGWCCTLGNKIKILAPKRIAERYRDYLQSILAQ